MNIFKEEIINEIKKLGEIDRIASRKRKWGNGIMNEIQFEELKYPPDFLPYRIKKIKGIIRHCETILRNSNCPYLSLKCRGCSTKKISQMRKKYFTERQIVFSIP